MTDDADWVLLCECNSLGELHTLRATLEARGVPCRVHGENTYGVLGPIHGAAVRTRVLVPRRALGVARTLAEDIVGPFDERPQADDDDDDASPFRTEADDAADDSSAGDEDDERAPGDALAQRSAPGPLRPRSYATLVLIACIGGPLLGLSHLYVRRNATAGLLALASVFAIAALSQGAAWAVAVLAMVVIVDIVGGALGVAAHNRRLAGLPAPRPTESA